MAKKFFSEVSKWKIFKDACFLAHEFASEAYEEYDLSLQKNN